MDVLIHIDETTKEQLQNQASRAGQSFDDYVAGLLRECAEHPRANESAETSQEAQLLSEYHSLAAKKRDRIITAEERARLQVVEDLLDDLDEQTPGARYMRDQMGLIQTTLDQLLNTVSALPRVTQ